MMIDPGKIMAEQTTPSAEVQRLRAANAQKLEQLRLAQKLMLEMDQKIRAVKGNEQRLLFAYQQVRNMLDDVANSWVFNFLPRKLKQRIFGELFG